jgi:hypothetical protein
MSMGLFLEAMAIIAWSTGTESQAEKAGSAGLVVCLQKQADKRGFLHFILAGHRTGVEIDLH